MEKFWGFLSFKMGRKISFSRELGKKDATKHDIKEDFLRKFVDIWVDFNFRDSFLSKHDFCSSSIIWNNSLVRIANRPFYKHWAEAGVQNIKNLVNDDFKVITYGEFRDKYCLYASFLEFYGGTSAIRSAMKSLKLKTPDGKDQGFSMQKLIAATKPSKLAYRILIQKILLGPERVKKNG